LLIYQYVTNSVLATKYGAWL